MKTIFEIDSNSDEFETNDFEIITHAKGFALALSDIQEKIHYMIDRENLSEENIVLLESLQDYLVSLKDEYHLPELI